MTFTFFFLRGKNKGGIVIVSECLNIVLNVSSEVIHRPVDQVIRTVTVSDEPEAMRKKLKGSKRV